MNNTYLAHFGLVEEPYSTSPNPRYLYISPTHNLALDKTKWTITTKRGLALVFGPVGTGKTTLAWELLYFIVSDFMLTAKRFLHMGALQVIGGELSLFTSGREGAGASRFSVRPPRPPIKRAQSCPRVRVPARRARVRDSEGFRSGLRPFRFAKIFALRAMHGA